MNDHYKRILEERRAERRAARENDKLHPVAPLCVQCGKPLRRYSHRTKYPARQWGDYGDGLFCGLRCGHSWAIRRATR